MDSEHNKIILFPLLSGGLDSTVATLIAMEKYDLPSVELVKPIFFDRRAEYKLKRSHSAYQKEKESLDLIISELGLEKPCEIKIPFSWYAEAKDKISDAFPYARNLVLLSLAISYSSTLNHGDNNKIIVGFLKDDDHSPDTSSDFISKFNEIIDLTIDNNREHDIVEIEAPLIEMTKGEAIKFVYERGRGELIKMTWSCYGDGDNTNGNHCGKCFGCTTRKKAFQDVDIDDPTDYEN